LFDHRQRYFQSKNDQPEGHGKTLNYGGFNNDGNKKRCALWCPAQNVNTESLEDNEILYILKPSRISQSTTNEVPKEFAIKESKERGPYSV